MKSKPNKEIEILVAAFENGETSKVEEERLGKLLQLEENKTKFPEEAALFSYFNTAKKEAKSTSFVEHIFENQLTETKTTSTFSTQFGQILKYVAVLTIALSATFFTAKYQQDKQHKKAEMAFIETKKALFVISKEMNNATQKLSEIEDFTKQTQKYINP
jgi:two-component SAPR family response regulator